MRRYRSCLLIFISIYIAAICVCAVLSQAVPECPAVSKLSPAALEDGCIISGWQTSREDESNYRITLTGADPQTPMALTLCDIGSFELWQDGKLLHSYDVSRGYISSHVLPLYPADTLNLVLKAEPDAISDSDRFFPAIHTKTRILISTTQRAAWMNRFVLCVNAGTIGAYMIVIIYSLSLYAQKRSEKSLLLLCGLALIALVSSLTNSNLVADVFANINSFVRYVRVVLCTVIAFHLMNIHPPGKWAFLTNWQGSIIFSALLSFMDALGLSFLVEELCYLTILPCCFACITGLRRRTRGALTLTFGIAVRDGFRLYHRLLLAGILNTPEFFHYFYIPQAYNLFFVLCCILIVNECFAYKFQEADELTQQLTHLNRHLDSLVLTRTKELEQANRLLQEAQQRKRRMMTNIFHDLRTPIFCAQGSAEMITVTDKDSIRRMDVLRDQLDYLAHISQELFVLANIEEKAEKFELFRIRSQILCEPIAAAAKIQAEQANIRFTASIEENLLFSGDAYQMKRALNNLLSNAFKFTPEGGTVCFDVFKDGDHILFNVSDTGPGLTPEDQKNIFERPRGSGGFSGFGLSIASAIVSGHHGVIDVKSTLGSGTTFSIRIPLEKTEPAAPTSVQ